MKPQANSEQRYSEEAFKLLPASVSGIQIQKKNKNRYSIFVNNEFLIGVSEAVLTKFGILKGVEITPSFLHEIVEAEDKWAVKEYFIRILSRRDHSRQELKTKALQKGHPAMFMDEVLDQLEKNSYINDESFALKYAADKFEFNDWGPYKIKTALMQKGISKSTSERVIKQVCGNDKIEVTIKKLVNKKKNRLSRKPEEKRRKIIFDFLMRKGYDSSDILKHMDELLESIAT